jgi:small G protein signaling modulator 3
MSFKKIARLSSMKILCTQFIVKICIAGGTCHPWLFVEEAAKREVERDYNSVYSRLVLCKTYRLDEDGKVLTPEEVNSFSTVPLSLL